MTATADAAQTRPAPGPLPAGDSPGTGEVRAELAESDAGWTLTLHLDPQAARAVRTQLSGHVVADIELGSVTASVLPNLVPGEPFRVDRFAVVVAEGDTVNGDPAKGDRAEPAADSRPLPG